MASGMARNSAAMHRTGGSQLFRWDSGAARQAANAGIAAIRNRRLKIANVQTNAVKRAAKRAGPATCERLVVSTTVTARMIPMAASAAWDHQRTAEVGGRPGGVFNRR